MHDSDEAAISDEDEDALQPLPLHKGGIIRPFEIIIKRGGSLRGGIFWGGYLKMISASWGIILKYMCGSTLGTPKPPPPAHRGSPSHGP